MNDDNNLEKVAMALYVYAAQLVKEGKTKDQIINTLMQRGVSRTSAETIMTRLNESRDNVTRRSGYVNLVFGAIVIMLSLFPLFGVVVPQANAIGTVLAILVMAIGIVIVGRGMLKVFVS